MIFKLNSVFLLKAMASSGPGFLEFLHHRLHTRESLPVREVLAGFRPSRPVLTVPMPWASKMAGEELLVSNWIERGHRGAVFLAFRKSVAVVDSRPVST